MKKDGFRLQFLQGMLSQALPCLTLLPRIFPITFIEAFLFTFPSPFFAAVVVFVARLIALSHTFLIMLTTMMNAMMLIRCLRLCLCH
jgi:hypothetical protein